MFGKCLILKIIILKIIKNIYNEKVWKRVWTYMEILIFSLLRKTDYIKIIISNRKNRDNPLNLITDDLAY